jgi:transcriptional regulator with XRE-family HTH domain
MYFRGDIKLKQMVKETKLTQLQIGQRICAMRKQKGLFQEDLAILVKMSRPSLTQVELGKRGLDIFELQRLSIALEFSLDEIMSMEFTSMSELEKNEAKKVTPKSERNSKPKLQINKFKNVLIYILEHCAGKPNVGETVLNKLMYFSDFNYYEIYEEHLTGAEYRKLPYGPVPQKLETIIYQMIEENQIQRLKTNYHNLAQNRFIPLVKADLKSLKASEKEVIDKVIAQMSDWSANSISAYSHNDMPWKASKEGDSINYELAFYREAPYSVRNYAEDTTI